MYIHMYIYIYCTCAYIYMCKYAHTHTLSSKRACIHNTCVHAKAYVHTYRHVCTFVHSQCIMCAL